MAHPRRDRTEDMSQPHYKVGQNCSSKSYFKQPTGHLFQVGSTTRDSGNQPQKRERLYKPLVRHKDVVDPAKLDVDLEAEVGKGLRGGFHHVLDLDALRGHSQERVPNALHLGCGQKQMNMNTQASSNAASSEAGKEIMAGGAEPAPLSRSKAPLLAPAPDAPYTGVFPGRMTMMS